MTGGGRGSAAGQNELLQARQLFIQRIEIPLQALDLRVRHRAMTGYAELATEVEQVVLHLGQAVSHPLRYAPDGEHYSERAVDLVDRAVRLDAQRILDGARAIAKPVVPSSPVRV